MHAGIVLLTKAPDKEEAIDNVNGFLEQYEGDVWDWYVIGGRWSGILNKQYHKFTELAKAHFKFAYPNNDSPFLTTAMFDEQKEALQNIWEGLGETTENPYSRSSDIDKGNVDDVVPLSECLEVVNKWKKDMVVIMQEYGGKMIEAYDTFSFDSNVYDIDNQTNNPEDALNEADSYFAVVVDLYS